MHVGILFLLSLVTAAQGGNWYNFIRKYATVKILSECLGEEYMMNWHKNYTGVVNFCQGQSPESFLRDLPLNEFSLDDVSYLPKNPFQSTNVDFPPNHSSHLPSVPMEEHSASTTVINLEDFVNGLQNNLTQPMLLVPLPYPLLQKLAHINAKNYFFRKKRESEPPIYDEKKIKDIYHKIQAKNGNFTCIFKSLNVFNAAFDINVMGLMSHYSSLNLDEHLKNDISEGIMDCIKFAACKPLNRMTLTPPVVQRAKAFLKCEAKQRVTACVKNDVRKMQNKFDMEALRGVEAGNEMDEGDKMLAILWGELSEEDIV